MNRRQFFGYGAKAAVAAAVLPTMVKADEPLTYKGAEVVIDAPETGIAACRSTVPHTVGYGFTQEQLRYAARQALDFYLKGAPA